MGRYNFERLDCCIQMEGKLQVTVTVKYITKEEFAKFISVVF